MKKSGFAASLVAVVSLSAVIAFASAGAGSGISADEALSKLLAGNKRYVENKMNTCGETTATAREKLSRDQKPYAIILSCSDSRVPPELIFDKSLGEIFVVRVAGNVPDPVVVGMRATGHQWATFLVEIGALLGLATVMLVMLLGQSRVFYSMSRDGLLPAWAGAVHPRFRTPWISSIAVGIFVAFFSALIPIGILGQLCNIGTLLAFIIVCAGIWVLRRTRPEVPRPFRTPWVPLVPILGIVISGLMMVSLPLDTWIRLIVWLIIGMVIYFTYSRRHSKVQQSGTPVSGPPVGAGYTERR